MAGIQQAVTGAVRDFTVMPFMGPFTPLAKTTKMGRKMYDMAGRTALGPLGFLWKGSSLNPEALRQGWLKLAQENPQLLPVPMPSGEPPTAIVAERKPESEENERFDPYVAPTPRTMYPWYNPYDRAAELEGVMPAWGSYGASLGMGALAATILSLFPKTRAHWLKGAILGMPLGNFLGYEIFDKPSMKRRVNKIVKDRHRARQLEALISSRHTKSSLDSQRDALNNLALYSWASTVV